MGAPDRRYYRDDFSSVYETQNIKFETVGESSPNWNTLYRQTFVGTPDTRGKRKLVDNF